MNASFNIYKEQAFEKVFYNTNLLSNISISELSVNVFILLCQRSSLATPYINAEYIFLLF